MILTIVHPTDRSNFSVVTIDSRTYWFSYRTCIGFSGPENNYGVTASENVWGSTTGRHLNHFSNRNQRIPADQFQAFLRGVVGADDR